MGREPTGLHHLTRCPKPFAAILVTGTTKIADRFSKISENKGSVEPPRFSVRRSSEQRSASQRFNISPDIP